MTREDERDRFSATPEEHYRWIVDSVPVMVWTARPDGTRDFVNNRWLQYTGLTLDDAIDGRFRDIHPEDRQSLISSWSAALGEGKSIEQEVRVLGADGEYRWFLQRIVPSRDPSGTIVKWFGTTTDIDGLKQAGAELGRSEVKHRTLMDLSPQATFQLNAQGEIVFSNRAGLELLRTSAQDLPGTSIDDTYTAEDLAACGTPLEKVQQGVQLFERTFLRRDGTRIPVEIVLSAMMSGWRVAVVRDMSEHKRAAKELQTAIREVSKSNEELRRVLDGIPAMVWSLDLASKTDFYNRRWLDYTGNTHDKMQGTGWQDSVHPDDRQRHAEKWRSCLAAGQPFEDEARLRAADGAYRWFIDRTVPIRDESGNISRWYGAATDVTDYKRVESELRQQEELLRRVIDVAPSHMFIWEADSSTSFGNRASREYFGPIPQMEPFKFLELVTHPEDIAKLRDAIRHALPREESLEVEARMRRHDGVYHWFLYQLYPLRDERGRLVRWCGTRIDIDARKQSENRAQRENLALREEIDKVSMFEEIIGTSPALQTVLERIAKVARTDSTVLITGETGTGKELVARALHKRSARAQMAFVSVNCAAIPQDLIASELFGHEKGAFTGALQRRLGRFELAEGGTIFLDEIGELPPETQVALLRILQEREFQRVGGSQSLRADVRVVAATHRDLQAAIEAGTFRSDLYYRINVFPLQVPPLRERKEDIRLLVEYFINRYATKAGKHIRTINQQSLYHLQAYRWPGNIRELQNVIERSVILCETDEFSVDESWLSGELVKARPLAEDLVAQERERIEAALTRSKGRVSGPTGAAMVLGIPPSTLDSKIKTLKIDKRRFQRA